LLPCCSDSQFGRCETKRHDQKLVQQAEQALNQWNTMYLKTDYWSAQGETRVHGSLGPFTHRNDKCPPGESHSARGAALRKAVSGPEGPLQPPKARHNIGKGWTVHGGNHRVEESDPTQTRFGRRAFCPRTGLPLVARQAPSPYRGGRTISDRPATSKTTSGPCGPESIDPPPLPDAGSLEPLLPASPLFSLFPSG
jgi:hypothetical protein